ncbi:MAG: hypothetical protein HOJ35_03775 [Bdellovibrionales bacterium]|jgi:hypothetical protein|nr:hypothetical protein [Bdellovibrionales bacterium]
MTEILRTLTYFTDEFLLVFGSLSIIILSLYIAYLLYNRKKTNEIFQQIPASVVKNYLDSIITNSNSLKSSLLKGGELVNEEGVPSIRPLDSLKNDGGTALASETKTEYTALKNEIDQKNNIINQLEDRVSELERSMKKSKVSDNVEDINQLAKERDELKERLLKFESLKDDISEIETIKEENESLKKTSTQVNESVEDDDDDISLDELYESVSKSPIKEDETAIASKEKEEEEKNVVSSVVEEEKEEDIAVTSDETKEEKEEDMAVSSKDEKKDSKGIDQKSAEELLSEFEKMLG